MKVVAFVPVKMNNERLPGKNIRRFHDGEVLISCILKSLLQVTELDKIFVYCSSQEIKNYLPEGIIYLERDTYFDRSDTSFNEVLQGFAKQIYSDFYVLAHATAPFVKPESISEGIKKVTSGDYDSAFAALKLQEFLWKDGQPVNYNPVAIPRTQDLPSIYMETCGLYIYSRKMILEEGRRIGKTPYLINVSKIEACDINTLEDFEIADAIHDYFYSNSN